jgi:ligand-binding SRPBCC domain-containing protein
VIHRIDKKLNLSIGLGEAWNFFSDPRNLKLLTPPELKMTITSSPPEEIYAGLIVTYRVYPFLNIPFEWVTEITHVKEPFYFVDEQRAGPYRMWHHQHHLAEVPGGIEVREIVDYIMPFDLNIGRKLLSTFSEGRKVKKL